ncbi:hypothetical protein RYX36_015540, partial [Vicia faba]
MAGGGFAVDKPVTGINIDGKLTLSIIITCVVAASGGLLFGYDIGVSGGVTTMVPFLQKFFPEILRKAVGTEVNMYCVYDSQVLTLFTSSLYLAGLVSSLAASKVTAAYGRRNVIILGGCVFLAGGAINGGSENIPMLILGRIFLGLGVGFTNQAAPLYLSEIAPPKWRGAFSTGFQFFLGIGVLFNYFIYIFFKWNLQLLRFCTTMVILKDMENCFSEGTKGTMSFSKTQEKEETKAGERWKRIKASDTMLKLEMLCISIFYCIAFYKSQLNYFTLLRFFFPFYSIFFILTSFLQLFIILCINLFFFTHYFSIYIYIFFIHYLLLFSHSFLQFYISIYYCLLM